MEVEGLTLGGLESLFLRFHLCNKSFLQSPEVGNRSSTWRLEWEAEISLDCRHGGIKVSFDTALFLIFTFLHAWWQLCFLVALLGIALDTLLSFVFFNLDHLLVLGHKDLPWNDSGPELLHHLRSDLVNQLSLSLLFEVALIERERFLGSFGLGHTCFLVFLSSFDVLPLNMLEERL